MIIGSLLVLLASIGILRMPDVFMRASVVTKAATLGSGFLLAGTAFYFNELTITVKAIAIIFFVFVTGPVGAHLLGRAAYFTRDKLWKGTVKDELKGMYDRQEHYLHSERTEKKKEEEKDKQ